MVLATPHPKSSVSRVKFMNKTVIFIPGNRLSKELAPGFSFIIQSPATLIERIYQMQSRGDYSQISSDFNMVSGIKEDSKRSYIKKITEEGVSLIEVADDNIINYDSPNIGLLKNLNIIKVSANPPVNAECFGNNMFVSIPVSLAALTNVLTNLNSGNETLMH